MTRGEFLTRLTIWLALIAYAVGAGLLLRARRDPGEWPPARVAWTIGCVFFLAHVACAFGYYHHWSHDAALDDTARQTAGMTGWRWGGGLYFNYIFAAAWLADVVWWWLAPARFAARSLRLNCLWHGFILFMVFNGTVVFGKGPVRWLGALICGSLATLWWWERHRVITPPTAAP